MPFSFETAPASRLMPQQRKLPMEAQVRMTGRPGERAEISAISAAIEAAPAVSKVFKLGA